jgi:adenine-specific DNA methylase
MQHGQRRDKTSGLSASNSHNANTPQAPEVETIGWQSSCSCDARAVPAVVLDPFLGAGTTALVADRLGRHCLGIELSPGYAGLARARVGGPALAAAA